VHEIPIPTIDTHFGIPRILSIAIEGAYRTTADIKRLCMINKSEARHLVSSELKRSSKY
jgi:hypothetical protein